MATVKSFSLPDEAVTVLEQIPKRERSEFVTLAILEAAKQKVKQKAVEAIQNFQRFDTDDDKSVVEVLRDIRQEA
jgi:hypothetical protein